MSIVWLNKDKTSIDPPEREREKERDRYRKRERERERGEREKRELYTLSMTHQALPSKALYLSL